MEECIDCKFNKVDDKQCLPVIKQCSFLLPPINLTYNNFTNKVHLKFNIISQLQTVPNDDKIELSFIVNSVVIRKDIVGLNVDLYYDMSYSDYVNSTILIEIKSNNCNNTVTVTKGNVKSVEILTSNTCFLYTNEAQITAPMVLSNVVLQDVYISNISVIVNGIQNTSYNIIIDNLGNVIIKYPSLSANQTVNIMITFQIYGEPLPFSYNTFTAIMTDNVYCN
jgi:hypothetical protein